MEEIKKDIRYEKKLLDLLGYTITGPDNSNRWLILDENNEEVGFIQYKKIFNMSLKQGLLAKYGYETFLNSSTIFWRSTRVVKKYDTRKTDYEFDIKRDNDETDHVEINLGIFPSLTIWSKQYGFIDFKVSENGFHLDYGSKTENFNIREYVSFFNEDEYYSNANYTYYIKYCDSATEIDNSNFKNIKLRDISGNYDRYHYDDNTLGVSEKYWNNGVLKTNRYNIVAGTVAEMATKHQMGIDSFSHFGYLINGILPFNEDALSILLSDVNMKNTGLDIFLSDSKDNQKQTSLVKKKNIR